MSEWSTYPIMAIMKQRIASPAALIIVVVILTACGGANAKQSSSRCQAAPTSLVARISNGLTVTGGGSLRGASTVQSKDFPKVWFVAADIQGAGLSGASDVGVWATNAINGAGLTFAVNAVAKEFSDWGDGGATDAHMTMSDDGANEAAACVASSLS